MPEFYNFAAVVDGYGEDRTKVALYWGNEAGDEKAVPYWKLRDESNRLANGLRSLEMKKEDKVLILQRIPEAYVA